MYVCKSVFKYVLAVVLLTNHITNILTEVVSFCKSGHIKLDKILVTERRTKLFV